MKRLLNTLVVLMLVSVVGCSQSESTAATSAPTGGTESTSGAASDAAEPAVDESTPSAGSVEPREDHAFVEVVQQNPENLPPPLLPRRSATQPPTPAEPIATPSRTDVANAPRIAPAKAWELVQSGRAVMVDVRHKEAFDFERITGSKNLTIEELPNRARAELSPTRWVIPYCT